MKDIDRNKMAIFRDRSDACLKAMDFMFQEPERYGDAVVLLAVHGSIALADAIQVACTGRRSNAQDHRVAVRELRKLCGERKIDGAGVNHFAWLIERKTRFSYGERRIKLSEVQDAALQAERFAKWAYNSFREISREEEEGHALET